MSLDRIKEAMARADEAVARGPHSRPADGRARRRTLAVGDPQADFTRFLALMEGHGLLGEDGRLVPEARLVSVGDHFDWGRVHDREAVATSALRLLAWLVSHPADQVVVLLGNHDLGRVGELASFSDERFAAAQAEADEVYWSEETDEARERSFLARWPEVPGVEVVARDLSTFREVQREWVAFLLRAGRLRAAHAVGEDMVVLHAGVTREDLRVVGLPENEERRARAVAEALNGALDEAVAGWSTGPLKIPGLHHPGNAADGEGVGIFYHRPSVMKEDAERHAHTPRRRFHPHRLPLGLTQVVGHTRDKRNRELLGLGRDGARDGVVRHLVTDGARLRYEVGAPPPASADEAVLVFTGGGMNEAPLEGLELFDLEARRPVRPR